MSGFAKHVVWSVWSAIARRTARAYVAGPTIEDALRVCRWLSERSLATTIGFWDGEEDPPDEVTARYLEVLNAIAAEKLDSYASIKASSIGYDWDLLVGILDRSRESNIGVHFDSIGPQTADETFGLIERASARHSLIGCTLPSRWVRSVDDAQRAVDLQVRVRVVKGQWADPDAPNLDPRVTYLEIIDRLSGRAPSVAVATHDVFLARESLKRLLASSTRCEVELLFGLPVRPALALALELRVPARLYVPYGEAYLPYTLSQARRRPRTVWWILRDTLLGRTLFVPRSYGR
jgi:proline dehydrogenase